MSWRGLSSARGAWRFILAAAGLAVVASQVLPAGHRLRADLGGSAAALGWLVAAAVPITAYALWVRSLRRRAGADRPARRHPAGLVQIADDVALLADTAAALDAETAAALGPARPLSLAWRSEDGALTGHLRLRESGATAEIEALLVAPEHRGQGIGRRLLAAAETEARARGLARLAVAPGSWQAPAFFARMGYATTAEHDLGRGARRFRMERELP